MIKTEHYSRSCVVVVKKPKTRIFDSYVTAVTYIMEYGEMPDKDTWDGLNKKFLDAERLRLQSFINRKSGKLLDFDNDEDYFYLVVNGTQFKKEKDTKTNLNLIDQTWERAANFNVSPTYANERVISITVTQSSQGAWTASIALDNTDDVFYMKNVASSPVPPLRSPNVYFQEGDCIIESNDEVEIYLPDWEDNLKLVFTGYVSTVNVEDDGLTKRINLSCEDVTKALSVTRTNAFPSLDPVESEGDTITFYQSTWAGKKPEEVVKGILGRTFCDIFNDSALFTEAKSCLSELHDKNGATKTSDSFKALNTAIDRRVETYIKELYDENDKIVGWYGVKAKKSVDGKVASGDVAFILMGINQPVWSIQFASGTYDYLISDWKSNAQILDNIAKSTFFEFYVLPSGIPYFGPTNLKLPKMYDGNDEDQNTFNNFVQNNFHFTADKDIYVRKYSQVMDDRNLFTDLVITGSYLWGGYTHEFLRKLVIAPYKYRRQFGVRMMAQESKVGLITPESLAAYGEQRLWRQNSTLHTASMFLEGNSNLQPGTSCYVDRWTSVYYINRVVHNFVAGADYSTTIDLSYRRKPFYVIEGNNINQLKGYLTHLVEIQSMSLSQMNFILANVEDLTWGKVKMYVNNDVVNYVEGLLVWDAIPSNLYPSIVQQQEYLQSYLKNETAKIKENYNKIIFSGTRNESEIIKVKDERDTALNTLKERLTKVSKSINASSFANDTVIRNTKDTTYLKYRSEQGCNNVK